MAKKPPKGPHHHPPLVRDRSLESSEKQRQEARKRLMAAKRAASVRQNSATESADSIEIYIPEAQTRLWGCYTLTSSTHTHSSVYMYGCPHHSTVFGCKQYIHIFNGRIVFWNDPHEYVRLSRNTLSVISIVAVKHGKIPPNTHTHTLHSSTSGVQTHTGPLMNDRPCMCFWLWVFHMCGWKKYSLIPQALIYLDK